MNKNLSTDQKVEILRKAIEEGASINIYFHTDSDSDVNEESALATANSFADMYVSGSVEKHSTSGTEWFEVLGDSSLELAVFYKYKSEDEDEETV
ncbi:hypothetical protein GJU40_01690 [Bacillus lacus]|uniref:Uncharacterized protein n=1 Tax=Metabacillus lacus TaxID=1983721 RepID=A0A7X2LYQ8_9BACI|nr:hypothetical protein [Metabacillus lacus]MRX70879.1 hypothetical protein [Metabacillus lacus]